MSVLTNRWAQGAVAFAVLVLGFFVYQANSEDVQVASTEVNDDEVQADNSNQGNAVNETVQTENAVNETTTGEENNVDTTKTVYIKDEGVELTEIEVDITE